MLLPIAMNKKTSPSLLRQITYIESLIRLVKDDLIRDHLLHDLNAVNLAISQLESFRRIASEGSQSNERDSRKIAIPN